MLKNTSTDTYMKSGLLFWVDKTMVVFQYKLKYHHQHKEYDR